MGNAIVGIGELLWDVFPNGKVLGGAPANFVYHAAQFGYSGYAVSAVGDDPLGDEILSVLESKKLQHLVEKVDYPTGTVQVTLDEKGVPQYEICENVAWDNILFSPCTEKLARNTQVVSFGSLAQRNGVSRNSIREFVKAMPSGSLKIFDINLRQHFYTKEVIHESLELVNMLKINDEELVEIAHLYNFEDEDEQAVCRRLIEMYDLDILVLTKGVDGSFVFTLSETSFKPTPRVHVADTVGAGDSFTGAFVASYMHGNCISDAHQLATEISAYVCTQHGAMPKLPDSYLKLLRK